MQDSGVSAFAADCYVSPMIERTAKAALPSITARPSAEEKARFRALAMRAGMSESALALVAIRTLLDPDCKSPSTVTRSMERVAATDRINGQLETPIGWICRVFRVFATPLIFLVRRRTGEIRLGSDWNGDHYNRMICLDF